MAPQSTPTTNNQPPSTLDTESAVWCIPFLVFYAIGTFASMVVTWASEKYNKRPLWPPAGFRKKTRSGPVYQVVLYLPALLWIAVLAAGILCLLGTAILHMWEWLVWKLSSASGRPSPCDEVSSSGQTCGVDRAPLSPMGNIPVDTSKFDVVRVQQYTQNITVAEAGVPRSTLGSQEHAVHVQQLSAADKNIRQEPGDGEEQSQKGEKLESRCD